MTVSYDQFADVLYVTLADNVKHQRYVENAQGDIIRYDGANKAIGCTIPSISQRGHVIVPELGITLGCPPGDAKPE